jgi:AraC-like DNA-binding protein
MAVSTKELTISKIDEDFLVEVVELIEKNIDNGEFDIEYFSKNIGVSTSQLYRKIKSITGYSPNEFIRTYRLKKAARMIRETNLNVSEIAYKVGFNDALYFSKCFKKQFGTSPSTFSFDS